MAEIGSKRHVAYLTSLYPALSHTFILREIAALRRLGFAVSVTSIRRPPAKQVLGEAERAAEAETYYVLNAARNPVTLARALAGALRTPGRFFRTLGLAMQAGRPGARGLLWQLFYFLEAAVLTRYLRAEEATHLHCHFADAPANVAMLTSELSGIPFSYTLHGPAELYEPRSWRIDEKTARAAFTVCISHFARSQCMYISDPAHWPRIRIVHCGVQPSVYRQPDHRQGSDRVELIFVGRLTAIKGLRVLLDALPRALERSPDLRLTLVGDGDDRAELERLAAPLGEAVVFAGPLSQPEVAERLQRADVFVLPSFAEGVPVVLMEAMASGLPVIATQVAGIPELVEDGVSGRLVPPGDPESLADAIVESASDPKARQRMGATGRAKVEAEFDIDREAARLAALFAGVGGGDLRPEPLSEG